MTELLKKWSLAFTGCLIMLNILFVNSCGSSGDSGDNEPLQPPIGDLSGEWEAEIIVYGNSEDSKYGTEYPYTDTALFVINQDGNNITLTVTEEDVTGNCTLSGARIQCDVVIDYGDNSRDEISFSGTVSNDLEQFEGNGTWRYIESGYSTSGTNKITAVKRTSYAPSPPEGANNPPQPADDYAQTLSGEPVLIPVLYNDVDPDGDALRIVEVGQPGSGSAEIVDDAIRFTPQPDHGGDVVFSYTVADDSEERARAWVFLTIIDRNASLSLTPDVITVSENSSSTVSLSELLANDMDFFGGELSVIALGEARNGKVTLNASSFTYTPNTDFLGLDDFTYTVQSQSGNTASSTVEVTVVPD